MNVAKQLKKYRKKNKLTKLALAQKLQISHVNIVRWELEQVEPTPRSLEVLEEHGIIKQKRKKKCPKSTK